MKATFFLKDNNGTLYVLNSLEAVILLLHRGCQECANITIARTEELLGDTITAEEVEQLLAHRAEEARLAKTTVSVNA